MSHYVVSPIRNTCSEMSFIVLFHGQCHCSHHLTQSSPIFKTPVSDMSAYLDCFTREGNLSAVPCFTLDPLPHHTLNLIDSSGKLTRKFEDLSPQLSNQSSVNCFSWYLFLARIHQSEWCNVCSSVLEILQFNHVKILRYNTVSNRNLKSLYNLSSFPQYVKIFKTNFWHHLHWSDNRSMEWKMLNPFQMLIFRQQQKSINQKFFYFLVYRVSYIHIHVIWTVNIKMRKRGRSYVEQASWS